MKTQRLLFVLIILTLISCNSEKQKVKPALAEARPVIDTYFGNKVTDPYRYMENLKDTTVQNWIKAQTDYSRNILDGIPGRQELIDKMLAMYSEEKIADPDHLPGLFAYQVKLAQYQLVILP